MVRHPYNSNFNNLRHISCNNEIGLFQPYQNLKLNSYQIKNLKIPPKTIELADFKNVLKF